LSKFKCWLCGVEEENMGLINGNHECAWCYKGMKALGDEECLNREAIE